jgi:RNA polymerase sigma factor (sigma-70 family)
MEVSALKYHGAFGLHARSPLLRLQSDERLVAFTRRGNVAAFEVLVGRYESRLLAFCRHLLGSREDAEDILQEVLAAAFNALLADDRPIKVRPWLYRIARNRCLNHLRRNTAVGVDSMDIHYSDSGASTADKVHAREEFRILVGDIQELPETQRTALVLREMDAMSYEQIADAMETTVPSVKSLLVRARVSLAEAAEARLLSCDQVRIELGEIAEGLRRRPSPLVRRHLRTCDRCSTFRTQLKQTNRALAALLPFGPLVAFKKLALGHVLSHSAGYGAAKSGAAAGSGATAASSAGVAGTGAAASAAGTSVAGSSAMAGSAIAVSSGAGGLVSAGVSAVATKAVAGLAAAALVTAGAVEVGGSGRRTLHGAQAALTPAATALPLARPERGSRVRAGHKSIKHKGKHASATAQTKGALLASTGAAASKAQQKHLAKSGLLKSETPAVPAPATGQTVVSIDPTRLKLGCPSTISAASAVGGPLDATSCSPDPNQGMLTGGGGTGGSSSAPAAPGSDSAGGIGGSGGSPAGSSGGGTTGSGGSGDGSTAGGVTGSGGADGSDGPGSGTVDSGGGAPGGSGADGTGPASGGVASAQ